MRVLALDTTARAGSVALVEDERIIAERTGDGLRSHAERLPTDIIELLTECAIKLSSIDVFAVAAGPGSFTGLRIGIATIQGLAFANRRQVVTVSALEALAQSMVPGIEPESVIGAWMDAYRREVFSALYQVSATARPVLERLTELDGVAVGDPAATLSRWARFGRPTALIGDGAVVYRALVDERVRIVEPPPIAGIIGQIAVARAAQGLAVDPAGVHPLYVRRPDAEVARERRTTTVSGSGS